MFVNEVICIAFAAQNLCGDNKAEMATFITLNLLGTQLMPDVLSGMTEHVLGVVYNVLVYDVLAQ